MSKFLAGKSSSRKIHCYIKLANAWIILNSGWPNSR
jgi:hypothetical protein